jgi:hypothetical protein
MTPERRANVTPQLSSSRGRVAQRSLKGIGGGDLAGAFVFDP